MNLKTVWEVAKNISNVHQNRIVFIHVPKCGGNSVGSAIKNSYGFWTNLRRKGLTGVNHKASKSASEFLDEPLYQTRRKILIYHLSQKENKFIKGHVGISTRIIEEFTDDWNFITILRDPIERWYSEYFYNKYKESDHFKTNLDLEEYVSSQVGIKNAHKYVTYFSGNKNVKEAKDNLSKFTVVGLLEAITTFKKKFYQEFSVNLDIPHKNESPAPKHVRDDIPESIHQKVVEICEADIEIYNWAKENLINKS